MCPIFSDQYLPSPRHSLCYTATCLGQRRVSVVLVGGIFTGQYPVQHSKKEMRLLQQIISCSMPARTADRVPEALDADEPWASRSDFMQCLAAVTSKYKADMARKVRNGCRSVRPSMFLPYPNTDCFYSMWM